MDSEEEFDENDSEENSPEVQRTEFVLRYMGNGPMPPLDTLAARFKDNSLKGGRRALPAEEETWHTFPEPPRLWMTFVTVQEAKDTLGSVRVLFLRYKICPYFIDTAIADVVDVAGKNEWALMTVAVA